ncbi:ExbD/TolR family protein [Brasilonema octagenarum]|uniref:Biopolymer transporter ExbD n=1 Tax=Brasilonema octagenarum UFV-OR1 TaxID=417115 RepID=A0ABX1M2P9_9CYAN|nr:biopolymer transporter ExbD [Brasilonema octagenarum]NMF62763.1 biopolymer transporter ExbD [Brasilonema octagenarum UFV-OR1]
MKINLQTPVEDVQIQIIPLIDVVFCILTFFLLAALQFTRQEEISINLPKSTTSTPSITNKPNANTLSATAQRQILTLTIDAIGQTYVENDSVKREQIKETFKSHLQQTPNAILALKVSQTATYNDVISMIDLWRQVGGDRISFVTTPSFSNQPTTSPLPSSGSAPAIPSLPNTSPITPINPQTNPYFNLPTIPNPSQINQGVSPVNPGTSPVLPKVPTAPSGQTNPTPKR